MKPKKRKPGAWCLVPSDSQLNEEEIDAIVELYRDRFNGQWNNSTELRILCMNAYERQLD